MVTLNVRAVDAETDKGFGPFAYSGKTVNVSVVVLPVSAPVPTFADAVIAADALEETNAPLSVVEPDDKAIVGNPHFASFAAKLAKDARIWRVPPAGAVINLGPLVDPVAGWWIATLPGESDGYEFEPLVWFVTGSESLTIYAYSKSLDALAREVLEKRGKAKREIAKLAPEWGGSVSAVPGAVLDMVHYYVENSLPPKDPRLAAYWIGDLSWAVMDFAIPAREFDLLVDRYARLRAITATVPWPDIVYFERCAYGIPVTLGNDGQPYTILNWRNCVPAFSAYFPRDDAQIRRDLGAVWLANLGDIFACIVRKVEEKVKEAKASERFWRIARPLIGILLMPGPASFIAAAGQAAKDLYLNNLFERLCKKQEYVSTESCQKYLTQAFDFGVSEGIALLGGGVALPAFESTVKDAFERAIGFLAQAVTSTGLKDLMSIAKEAEKLALLAGDQKAASALGALGDVGANIQAQDLIAKVQAGMTYEEFVQAALGLDAVPPALIPWILWCFATTALGEMLAQVFELAKSVAELLGQVWNLPEVDPQGQIYGPLIGSANAAGVTVSQDVQTMLAESGPSSTAAYVVGGLTVAGILATVGYLLVRGKL